MHPIIDLVRVDLVRVDSMVIHLVIVDSMVNDLLRVDLDHDTKSWFGTLVTQISITHENCYCQDLKGLRKGGGGEKRWREGRGRKGEGKEGGREGRKKKGYNQLFYTAIALSVAEEWWGRCVFTSQKQLVQFQCCKGNIPLLSRLYENGGHHRKGLKEVPWELRGTLG